ncbi:MAG: hypothetical protein R6X23_13880 [Acidimicrobiia bacterium]
MGAILPQWMHGCGPVGSSWYEGADSRPQPRSGYPFFPGTLMEEDGDLATQIPPLQEAAIARGRMVWDGLLDVQGFSQEAYEQLLDISSAFLETVQATALAAVEPSSRRTSWSAVRRRRPTPAWPCGSGPTSPA